MQGLFLTVKDYLIVQPVDKSYYTILDYNGRWVYDGYMTPEQIIALAFMFFFIGWLIIGANNLTKK